MEAITTLVSLAVSESIKNLAKEMTSFLTKKVPEYYKDTKNKELIDSGWAFEDYLMRVYDTYSKSKSILYTNEARSIESFFVPIDIELKKEFPKRKLPELCMTRSFSDIKISSKDIRNITELGNKIIISGSGGTGKTILMKHFCINSIKNSYKIPVYISLRWFNNINIGDEPIEKLIYSKLCDFGFHLDYEYFKYSLESDYYIILFDGYDELDKDYMPHIAERIQSFSQRYPQNSFIISSRDIDNIFSWEEYKVFSLCPLTREQSIRLIRKLDFDIESKEKFVKELSGKVYSQYYTFVSRPLLLSILFLTYSENRVIPDSLQDFYEKAFETLLYKHDLMKVGLERKLDSGLKYYNFKKIFLCLCFKTYCRSEYSFSETKLIERVYEASQKMNVSVDEHAYINDLLFIACMIIRDGNELTFIHRNFQEYFAASYVYMKGDDIQQRFCEEFIHSSNEGLISYIYNYGSESICLNSKTKDFLDVLCRIEPERFEKIVLEPILKKIYDVYLNCECNMFLTMTTLFGYYFDDRMSTGIAPFESGAGVGIIVYVRCSRTNRIREGDIPVILYFYRDYLSCVEQYVSDEDKRWIFKYLESDGAKDGNSVGPRTGVIVSMYEEYYSLENFTQRFRKKIMLYLFYAVRKYESIAIIQKRKRSYNEIIDSI